MKKLVLGIGIFLIVLIGAVCALPFLIPASTYNRVAETHLEKALGRDVTLGADTRIMIFPNLGAKIKSVQIANADGFDDPYFMKADELAVAVKWLPLFSKTVEIASLKFDGAEVLLHQKSATDNNWTFAAPTAEKEPDTDIKDEDPAGPGFNAVIPKAELTRSKLVFRDDLAGSVYRIDPINLTAKIEGVDTPVELSGDVTLNDEKFDISLVTGSVNGLTSSTDLPIDVSVKSGPADATFKGQLVLGDAIAVTGDFTAALRDAPKLLDVIDMKLDQDLGFVGNVSASGKVSGEIPQLKLEGLDIEQSGKLSRASFKGDALLAETPVLNGSASFETSKLGDLLKAVGVAVEQDLNVLGAIKGSAALSGSPENLRASGVNVSVDGSSLKSSFNGEVGLTKAGPGVSGNLKAESSNLRKLLTDLGVAFDAPTPNAFKSFRADLSLTQSGNRTNTQINTMIVDELVVDGTFGLNLSGVTPYLDINLTLPKADLSPYMSDTKNPPSQADPNAGWSEDPIDLSILRTVNADAKIYVSELTDGRATIRDMRLSGALLNGAFEGKFTSLEPDGGRQGTPIGIDPLFNGSLTVGTKIAVAPDGQIQLALNSDGSGITTAALIKFFTGMDVLEGVAELKSDVTTNGLSVADFVRNLDGTYNAQIADGAIFGVNLPQLLRSAQSALLSGKLPSALSPGEKTDFSSLELDGSIASGIASIDLFQLNAPFIRANASGTIDLFNRTMDIRIMPKAVTTSQGQGSELGVNGFGIPLKVTGSWTAIKGSLDTEFILNLAKQEATSRLADEVTNRLGGDLGSVLDSALGIDRSKTTAPAETTEPIAPSENGNELVEPTPTPTATPTPTDPKKQAEDAAKSLIMDSLFGKKKSD